MAKFQPGDLYLGRLRDAMFSDQGVSHDVLKQVAAFAKYDRNGIDVELEFQTGQTLSAKMRRFIFQLAKQQMEDTVNASGYGWDDEDREDEVSDECCRYLLARERQEGGGGKLVGFVDFRFTLQGDTAQAFEGFPILHVSDLQIAPDMQRKGLGRHLLMTLEMIARKQKMTYLTMRVFKGNDAGEAFVANKLKGFEPDYTWVSRSEPFQLLQKLLCPDDLKREGIVATASPQAVTPPSQPADSAVKAVPKAAPVKLDAQFAAAIKLDKPQTTTPDHAAMLSWFYKEVVNEPKTSQQISDIIEKRRRSSTQWFEVLCGKLAKKYGQDPRKVWEEKEAKSSEMASTVLSNRAARTEKLAKDNGDTEVASEARTTAMQELAKVFKEQHGREPTQDEIAGWQQKFDAAIAGAKKNVASDNALPSFGAQVQ